MASPLSLSLFHSASLSTLPCLSLQNRLHTLSAVAHHHCCRPAAAAALCPAAHSQRGSVALASGAKAPFTACISPHTTWDGTTWKLIHQQAAEHRANATKSEGTGLTRWWKKLNGGPVSHLDWKKEMCITVHRIHIRQPATIYWQKLFTWGSDGGGSSVRLGHWVACRLQQTDSICCWLTVGYYVAWGHPGPATSESNCPHPLPFSTFMKGEGGKRRGDEKERERDQHEVKQRASGQRHPVHK